MPNQFYSAFKETNDTGPKQTGTTAPDTTSNSKKGQRGGWVPTSALGRSPGAGRVSTSKGSGSGKRNSTNKSESGDGWRCSTNKGGGYG